MSEIIEIRDGDDTWGTVTVRSSGGQYRRQPCADCPWAVDSPVGAFPAEVFVHSARTAYDLAEQTFGCHTSTAERPVTCAGFLLRGAAHNLAARIRFADGVDVSDGGRELYPSYRAMALANGVPADHPALAPCRDDGGAR